MNATQIPYRLLTLLVLLLLGTRNVGAHDAIVSERSASQAVAEPCQTRDFTPTAGSVALTSLVGLTSGALSYAGWIFLHEGSHAGLIEAFGGNVVEFNFLPERMPGGGVRFASVSWEDPERRIGEREHALVSLAPNLLGLAVGSAGTALWATDHLPEDRLLRTAFATFQLGASINGGLIGVWNRNENLDVEKATRHLRLSKGESTALRTGLTTLAVINLIPAADSLVYGLTGRSLVSPRAQVRQTNSGSGPRVQLAPYASATSIGVQGRF
jgi:hypothetical protein